MKNLRIVREEHIIKTVYNERFIDLKYLVCKDIDNPNLSYTPEVIARGEIIESFQSKEHAELFIWALKQQNK